MIPLRKRNTRTKMARGYVFDFLNDVGAANTHEIYSHLQDRTRRPPVMNQLTNILSKDARFKRLGEEMVIGLDRNYRIAVWGLSND